MAINLPDIGQVDWGAELNSALTQLDNQTIVGGRVEDDDLILMSNSGGEVNAGRVTGEPGPPGPPGPGVDTDLLPYVNIADFGAVLDGSTDDKSAIDSAYAAVSDGGTIAAPSGSLIGTSGNYFSGKSVNIDFSGSTVFQLANTYAFHFDGQFSNVQNATVTARNLISVQDGSVFSPGDVIRLVSEDFIPGARHSSSGPRMGMASSVVSVAGNVLTIREPVHADDSFDTSPRVGIYAPDRVTLTVGEIRTPAGQQANRTAAFVMCSGLTKPVVHGTVMTESGGSGVGFRACYQPVSRGCYFQNFLNDTSSGHNGYGIIDAGSVLGEYEASGHNTRHLFSDGPASGDTTSLGNYGRSENARVTYRGVSGANQALDTHHGSRGHTFINPVLRGSSGGIALRGVGHSVIGGYITGASTGIRVFFESGVNGTSYGHIVSNVIMDDVGTAFSAGEETARGSYEVPTLTIDGGTYSFRDQAVVASRANVFFTGRPTFRSAGTTLAGGTGAPSAFQGYGGSFRGDLNVILDSITTGNVFCVFQGGSVSPSMVLNMFLRMNNYVSSNIGRILSPSSASVFADILTSSSMTDMSKVIPNQDPSNQRFTWRSVSTGTSSALYRMPVPANESLSFPVPNHDLTVRLTGSGDISSLPTGSFDGQSVRLHALNNGSSFNLVSGGNIIGTRTVAAGNSATVFWDDASSSWRTS